MSQPHHRFIAAGRAAQHCPELTARGPGPTELRARWTALGPALAEALAPRLAPLLGGKDPQIEASPAERLPTSLNQTAIAPYSAGTINAEQAIANGGKEFHAFMLRQTRKSDLAMFADMAKAPKFAKGEDVPFSILLPAFVTSELKTAFQIGFMLFLPFLVVDLVVSSVLMSLGMMMMSPTIVSLPFKLLLFVLVDGWALLMGSLAASFG